MDDTPSISRLSAKDVYATEPPSILSHDYSAVKRPDSLHLGTQILTTIQIRPTSPMPEKAKFPTKGWKWEPVAAPPVRDEDGTLHFSDFLDFKPNKTPQEILQEGGFGGSYFWSFRCRKVTLIHGTNQCRELPAEWTKDIDDMYYVPDNKSYPYVAYVNKFKVSCGQLEDEWMAAGQFFAFTLLARELVLKRVLCQGWFQWYCRFYLGRRAESDPRQIEIWAQRAGPDGLWRRQLLRQCQVLNMRSVNAEMVIDPVLQQSCHHWAYEPTQKELDAYWADVENIES